jgi:hypothetical protein
MDILLQALSVIHHYHALFLQVCVMASLATETERVKVPAVSANAMPGFTLSTRKPVFLKKHALLIAVSSELVISKQELVSATQDTLVTTVLPTHFSQLMQHPEQT